MIRIEDSHREKLLQLSKHDFELAYLTALTMTGLKPLSRWEKPLEGSIVDLIGEPDLAVRWISRRVRRGRVIRELILSRSNELLDRYLCEFEGSPVDKSPTTRRKEGYLFGYPPCCTEHFIKKPYDRNGLSPEDQKILFHWACPGCTLTRVLLPHYRTVYTWLKDADSGSYHIADRD
jgi:hypothetical protein